MSYVFCNNQLLCGRLKTVILIKTDALALSLIFEYTSSLNVHTITCILSSKMPASLTQDPVALGVEL